MANILHTTVKVDKKCWHHIVSVTVDREFLAITHLGKKNLTPRIYRRATSFDGGGWITDLVGLELLDKHGERVAVTAKAVGF